MGPLVFKDSRTDYHISEWGVKVCILLLFVRVYGSGLKRLVPIRLPLFLN